MFKSPPNKFLSLLVLVPLSVGAVNLDSSAPPDDTNSAMYTLQSICERLSSGATGSKRGATFVEPPSGTITAVVCSLNDIMNAAPAEDNSNGALVTEVLSGKTFWGLRTDGTWGLQTGTLATQTPTNSSVTQSAGNYSAFDLSAVDTDLASSNIKSGVTIFGVAGTVPIAAVAKTGQTTCYDTTGATISCANTGQDGDKQAGTTWPNPRFTDNGDGTVTDNLTSLIWLKNANCFGQKNWATALSYANGLSNGSCGLTDGSSAGDWHLPNWNELRSLIDAEYDDPALSNTAGTGKWTEGDAFSGVRLSFYWSSTTNAHNTSYAWHVNLTNGSVNNNDRTNADYVWPVRGGV